MRAAVPESSRASFPLASRSLPSYPAHSLSCRRLPVPRSLARVPSSFSRRLPARPPSSGPRPLHPWLPLTRPPFSGPRPLHPCPAKCPPAPGRPPSCRRGPSSPAHPLSCRQLPVPRSLARVLSSSSRRLPARPPSSGPRPLHPCPGKCPPSSGPHLFSPCHPPLCPAKCPPAPGRPPS